MDDPARACDSCACPRYRHRLTPAELWWAFRVLVALARQTR